MIIKISKNFITRVLKLLRNSLFLITLVVVIIAIALLSFDINRRWDDQSTWTTGENKLPTSQLPDIKMKLTQDGDKYSLTLDYCMLYKVDVSVETEALYHCSFLPALYFRNNQITQDNTVLGSNGTIVSDVQWKYVKGQVPRPDSYIMPVLSDYTYVSHLQDPSAVSLKMEYTIATPEKSLLNMISHYQDALAGKPTEKKVTISSWGVTKLPAAAEYFESNDTNQFLSNWSIQSYKSLKTALNLDQEVFKKTGQELLNALMNKFSILNTNCILQNYHVICTPGYAGNPAESVAYLMYIENGRGSNVPKEFSKAAAKTLFPFANIANPDYRPTVNAAPNCTGPDCKVDFIQMAVYQYPICPVADVAAGNWGSANVNFFKDYYTYIYRNENISDISALDKTISQINIGPRDASDQRMSGPEVNKFELACYKIVMNKNKVPAATREALRQKFLELLLSRLKYLSPDNAANFPADRIQALAYMVYESTHLEPYANEFLSDNAVLAGRSDASIKIDDLRTQIANYEQWKSIVYTLALISVVGTNAPTQ